MARPNDASAIAGHVRGLKEAKAAFQALPESMRLRLNTATETTLSEIVRHAKAKLQSSPSIQTRTLYNSIGYTLNKNNGRGKAGVQNVTTSVSIRTAHGVRKVKIKGALFLGNTAVSGKSVTMLSAQGTRVMKPVKYGPKVEFGTRNMRAEPFMIPAAKSQEQPYLDRCKRAGGEVERDMATIGMRGL